MEKQKINIDREEIHQSIVYLGVRWSEIKAKQRVVLAEALELKAIFKLNERLQKKMNKLIESGEYELSFSINEIERLILWQSIRVNYNYPSPRKLFMQIDPHLCSDQLICISKTKEIINS